MKIVVDFETYSDINLRSKPAPGVWAYAEHPSTEILCLAYKFDDMPTKIWTPPDPFPADLLFAIGEGCIFEAHNAQFERAIWTHLLHRKTHAKFYGEEYDLGTEPMPMPTLWRDTMAVCAYRSLPLSLDDVGDIINLDTRKSKDGKDVLNKLSKPRKPTKKDPSTRLSWEAAEALGLWQRLYAYCKQDVDTEYALAKALGWLTPDETAVWQLDQTINQRGMAVDLPSVYGARKIAATLNEQLTAELCALTGIADMTGKKVAQFKEWFAKNGLYLPDLQKETVEQALDSLNPHENPEDRDVYRALELRQQTSINSVAKLDALLVGINADGRMRGTTQYHAAGTGRWGGRMFQPHNLPRPTATNALDKDGKKYLDMDLLAEHLQTCDYDTLDMLYGNAGGALTSSLRGMLVAAPGKRLYVSDYSAIEARVTMWVAGQQDKLDAFYKYDADPKNNPDIYCVAAQDLYGHPVNKKEHPDKRQSGKVQILGCGYQMGWQKLQAQEKNNGNILSDETAQWIVKNYREKNTQVPKLWYGLQDACIEAIGTGKVYEFRGIEYRTIKDPAGPWLICTLPSGRRLWYYNPQLEKGEDWQGHPRWSIRYEGRDNKRGGAWGVVRTYGGMLTENVVQAISRDLLVGGMFRVTEAGYPIVLHVHDEIISETPDDFGDVKEFDRLVAGPTPSWAKGLPVAAEGWSGHRYKKG